MKFVDEITLECAAGNGGDGVVRWLQNRRIQKGGPAGGNGGRGGNVVVRAVRDTALLGKYRGNNVFEAGHGENGGKNSLHGHNGEDVGIDLPVGSVVTLSHKGDTFELLKEGEEITILKGGQGGYGNEHFKSSRNVTPTESTDGKPGEKDEIKVELRLIADIGFVGYPNAGKSSLLNVLTNAKAKVGNYAFTTLDPNLGEMFGYIIADIPGIIEGASEGKGLGYKFLRHISRTKSLIFCISVEQEEPLETYHALMNELVQYDENFKTVPHAIVLTKTDMTSESEVAALRETLTSLTDRIYDVSIYDDEAIKVLRDSLVKFMRELE